MGGPNVGGGWDVCIAEPYNLKPPCLVYSIGSVFLVLIVAGIQYSFNSASCKIYKVRPNYSDYRHCMQGRRTY